MKLSLYKKLKELVALFRLFFIAVYYHRNISRSGIIVIGSKAFQDRVFLVLSWIEARSKVVHAEIIKHIRLIFETTENKMLPDRCSSACKFKKYNIDQPQEILAFWLLFQSSRSKLYQEYCKKMNAKKAPKHVWDSMEVKMDCSKAAVETLKLLGASQEILNSYHYFHERHISGIKPEKVGDEWW